jgi:hypothetical protein
MQRAKREWSSVALVEFLVGVVEAAGDDLDGELVVLAHEAREIVRGVDIAFLPAQDPMLRRR